MCPVKSIPSAEITLPVTIPSAEITLPDVCIMTRGIAGSQVTLCGECCEVLMGHAAYGRGYWRVGKGGGGGGEAYGRSIYFVNILL